MHVADDDVELKMPVTVNMTEVTLIEKDVLNMLLLRISSWKKLKRVMCYILKFIQSSKGVAVDKELTVDNMVEAERRIFKLDQKNEMFEILNLTTCGLIIEIDFSIMTIIFTKTITSKIHHQLQKIFICNLGLK